MVFCSRPRYNINRETSSLNLRADWLSRKTSPYEWKLHPKVFGYLDRLWGLHSIDRFAALHNRQLPHYNSLYCDPEAEAVDCLAQDWRQENNYVNPPFWLIPRVLQLIKSQKCEATVIAPWWPGQSWFRTIIQMSIDEPRVLPRQNHWYIS